jgi:DNA-binding NarL/FixJ family response regulator
MLDLISPRRTASSDLARSGAATQTPTCPIHPDSLVRRFRTHGANGPGVYPQCVPGGGAQPHLLAWAEAEEETLLVRADSSGLTPCEISVLVDAASGMTVDETAERLHKGSETVKTQRRSILLKLGARNMAQAVWMTTMDDLLAHGEHDTAEHDTVEHG